MEHLDVRLEHNFRYSDSIGKYVTVKTVDSEEHQGWLRCIDPLSGNIILITVDDDYSKIVGCDLLMGDAVSSLEALREPDDKMNAFYEKLLREAEAAELAARKKLLIAWIKKNRLPVVEKEDQSLVVGECVTISPPYKIDDCTSSNGITLRSIRRMIAKMPLTIAQVE